MFPNYHSRMSKDLETHIHWNNEHGIKLFRLSSQIFPWMEEYELVRI